LHSNDKVLHLHNGNGLSNETVVIFLMTRHTGRRNK